MKIPGSYRLQEPIEHFKLRVKVVQRKSPLVELFAAENDSRDPNFLEVEERVFDWQEKIFSPLEVHFYADEKNCSTEPERKYRRCIEDSGTRGSLLYSYTQSDSYSADKGLPAKAFSSYLSAKNSLALPTIRNRKPFKKRHDKRVVADAIAVKRIRANHYLYTKRISMYFLADLSRKGEKLSSSTANPNPDAETLLCCVTYDTANRILTVEPDFTFDDPYVIINDSGLTYDYWIEPLSPNNLYNHLQYPRGEFERRQQFSHLKNTVCGPQLSPPDTRRIYLSIEIASTEGFQRDGLFVRYFIDLPRHWSTFCHGELSGQTQRSLVRNERAFFSYARDVTLDFDGSPSSGQISPNWPCLLLAVSSFDRWTRYRTEGYASFRLPTHPGTYKFSIPTWRAMGTTMDWLRRFFTGGGAYELKDIAPSNVPHFLHSSTLNESNVKVVPSGCVRINISVATQDRNINRHLHSMAGDFPKLGTTALISDVENVFKRFKTARERMIQIRNGVDQCT